MEILGLIAINDWLFLLSGLLGALYYYSMRKSEYWSKQGVPGPKLPPFFISFKNLFTEGLLRDSRLVKEYGDTVGDFEGKEPYLITTDDDILREVFVKQFHNFVDRRYTAVPENSGLEKAIFLLREEDGWKRIRDIMSPTFSSGKLKQMTGRINECSAEFVKSFDDMPPEGKEINIKDHYVDATMSLIATVAFGIDMKDKEVYKEFCTVARKVTAQNQNISLGQLFFFFFPKLALWLTRTFNIELQDLKPLQYFSKIVNQSLDTRSKGDRHTDFIQLMANAHMEGDATGNTEQNGMTREEILSNGLTFFLAGFDTVSGGLSAIMYQLACNPEAQEKLYQEVAEVLGSKGKIDYADVHELKYLDWCVYEALRMIPSAPKLERKAKDDITIKGIEISKNMLISIPVYALHFDEKRWPNPHVFRPERFSDEEKKDRSPFSWMPFGHGPRNCIAMRLALVEMKIVTAHMIYNFNVKPCSKTKIPYVLHKFGIIQDGMEFKLTRRENN